MGKKEKMELPKPIIPKKKKGSKTQKPPPIDKLIKPAIGIGIALLGYQFMKGIQSEIPRINPSDDLLLREVFFGEVISAGNETKAADAAADAEPVPVPAPGAPSGKSYAVLCHKELDDDNAATNIPVSSVFQDAYNDGSAPAEFRLLDCDYVLPDSGKTIAERFKLNLKNRPTIFVSGAGVDKPKQVPSKHLKTGSMLVKAFKSILEPKTTKIETTQDLRTKCLEHDICAILFRGHHSSASKSSVSTPKYIKDAMLQLIPEFPKVKFVSIDSNNLYLKNLEDMLSVELDDNNSNSYYRMAVMKKISGSSKTDKDKKDSGRLITSMATTDKSLSYGVMSNLIASVVTNKAKMTKLSSLPQIKTRTKKLLQEEKAKKQRRQEQQQRGAGASSKPSGSGSAGGFFNGENDGSREGRKAERERRRAEHYAKNNVKDRTPEEIAEMERQRRQRMAEEAEKWNIAPEDAPPEGDPIQEGDDDQEEDYTTTYVHEEDDGDSDDSESMDLDDDEELLDLD